MRPTWWIPLFVTACASSELVDTAYHGDLSALKAEIAAARASGDLDEDSTVELARAVIVRELASSGRAAADHIDGLRPCARALAEELRRRAERSDAGGARALSLLLDIGQLDSEPLVARYAEADAAPFRAVAARAALGVRHAGLRQRYFVDVDARVRRAAYEAARISASKSDLEALLEASRLEPDDLGRSRAMLAVGAIGGRRAVNGLFDLWKGRGTVDRLVLIEAWALEPSLEAGGRDRLVRVIESSIGLPRVAAAAALVRAGAKQDSLPHEVIVRTVSQGATDERRLAILSVPLDERGRRALRKAARDPDRLVQVLSWARLAERPAEREAARTGLRRLAKGDDSAAAQARRALAVLDDSAVVSRVLKEQKSPDPGDRRAAARSLLHLGRVTAVAPLLADPDITVRLDVACALLNRP